MVERLAVNQEVAGSIPVPSAVSEVRAPLRGAN